jgi:arsenate reductase (glutaredoxin)
VETKIYFNPSCSKCRDALEILKERNIEPEVIRYLDTPPTISDLEEAMRLLSIDDPRQMMRTAEPEYRDLGLAGATNDELLEAIVAHPRLLERPIFILGDRAVIGRPAERVLEIL